MSSDHIYQIIKQAPLESRPCLIGSRDHPEIQQQERLWAEQEAQQQALEQQSQEMLRQAEQQAEAMMTEARQEAVRLLQEAQHKLANLEAQARQQGLEQGLAMGKAELAQALNQFQMVLVAAHAERERLLQQAEQEVVHLVLEIVRKILRVEPIINEQVLIRVVREALSRLGQQVAVHIHVHPEDVDLLHFSLTQIEDLALEVVIEPDHSLEPGGCRIISRAGEIDASLKTQFEAIAHSFLAIAEGSGEIPYHENTLK